MKRTGPGTNKLSDRSLLTVFVGYEEGSKAYRVYDPVGGKLYVTRDVAFEERRSWDWSSSTADIAASTPTTFSVSYIVEPGVIVVDDGSGTYAEPCPRAQSPPDATTPVGSPKPTVEWCTPPSHDSALDATDEGDVALRYRRVTDLYNSSSPLEGVTSDEPDDHESEEEVLCLVTADEPASVEEVLAAPAWREAMQEEMNNIAENNTWAMSSLPVGHRAIGLKWVFKLKKDPDGNVVKHKARLVVKGYAQRKGVDFDEVFAPVARMETVRILLALAAHGGWEVHHMDVRSAFLNGDLSEEVYVLQPPGFMDKTRPHSVLKLSKALYGLRQAPRAWYAKLDSSLVELGFTRSPLEHAVYRRGTSDKYLLVGVYVDDLIIMGSSEHMIIAFKEEMKKTFRMIYLGKLSFYLGL
jgi:hypothetical protein